MKNSEKALKVSPIITALRDIDKTSSELKKLGQKKIDQHKKFATLLLRRKQKDITKLGISKEVERLISVAKGIVSDNHYKMEHEDLKNVWSSIRNIMTQRLAKSICPDVEIKTVAGKDDKGNVVTDNVKISQLPETYSGIAQTASALKKALSPESTDGRTGNKPKTKRGAQTAPKKAEAPQTHSAGTTVKGWEDSMILTYNAGTAAIKRLMKGLITLVSDEKRYTSLVKGFDTLGYEFSLKPKTK